MEKKTSIEGCLLALIWFPLLIVVTSIYHGFVLTKLWGWFIVPTFQLPQISLPAAIGLSLIVGYMAKDSKVSKSEQNDDPVGLMIGKATVSSLMTPTLALLMGWVIQKWM